MTSRKSTPDVTDAAWTSQERELLSVARQERMPSYLEARMREALDVQLGSAISGAESAPASTSTPLEQSVRASQLFGSKLSLWGVLSVLAIGSFAYLGLRGSTHSLHESKHEPSPPSAAAAFAQAASLEQAALTQYASSDRASALDPKVAPLGNTALAAQVRASEQDVAVALAAHGTPRPVRAEAHTSVSAATSARATATRVAARDRHTEPVSGTAADGDRARVTSHTSSRNAPVRADAPPDVDALRMEAELLDAARTALSRGALHEARQVLGRYSARFANGALLPESDVLGIELEMRTGQQLVAQSHATRFLSDYPNHPLRDRVRELANP